MRQSIDYRPNKLALIAAEAQLTVAQLVVREVDAAGSIAGAARNLSVNRNTIMYWMKKAGKRAVFRATIEEAI